MSSTHKRDYRRNSRATGIKTFDQSVEDFWANVDSTNLGDPLKCWEWIGWRNVFGYGVCYFQGKRMLANRASILVHQGAIPDGLCSCHRCDNPPCVNPNHLFLGTRSENQADSMAKGRARNFKHRPIYGEQCKTSKVKTADIVAIRASNLPQSKIAKQFRISQSNVSMIRTRKIWATV